MKAEARARATHGGWIAGAGVVAVCLATAGCATGEGSVSDAYEGPPGAPADVDAGARVRPVALDASVDVALADAGAEARAHDASRAGADAADGATEAATGDSGADAATGCATRTGGAVVTFEVAGAPIALWIEDSAFIDEARRLFGTGAQRVPVFAHVLDGADCDARWAFHVDPAAVSWSDATIEACDGAPSIIDASRSEWVGQQWCPWSAKVVAIDDRR